LIRYLRASGAYNRSLLVVVGDHGEGLGEHQEETHGIFLYDTTTHVPLIMKLHASAHAGQVIDAQVRTIDIAPTLLELTGAATAAHFDGMSLAPLLAAPSGESRPAAGETDYPRHFGWAPLRSLRAGGYKFVEAPKPELYDLTADPGEEKNIYEPWNVVVAKSRAAMAAAKLNATASKSTGAVSANTVAELRALGYLGPEGATDVPEPLLLPDPKDKIQEQNLLHRAMVENEAGHAEAARAALKLALASDPQSALVLMQLGQLELDSGHNAQAVDYCRRARAVQPTNAVAALCEGSALAAAGDVEAAASALSESLRLAPSQFDARKLLGQLFLRRNDNRHAEDQLAAAVFLRPDDASIRIDLARALIANSDYRKAAEQLEQSVKLDDRNRLAYTLLEQVYTKLGNNQAARRARLRSRGLPHAASKAR